MQSELKSIYLGNLPIAATEEDVRSLFSPYGQVADVLLVYDPDTGHSRGFGFVKMAAADAARAIDALDGSEFRDRALRVNEARDRGAKAPRRAW